MNNQNLITMKKKNELLNILMFGYVFIIIGIYSLVFLNISGLIFIIIGLIVTFKKGIIVDTKNKRIINYKTYALFYTKKEFTDISNVQYIALIRVNLRQQMNVGPITGLSDYSEMQVKLNFITNSKTVIPLYVERKKNVFPVAKQIAKGLNLRIFDNSEGKKVWI